MKDKTHSLWAWEMVGTAGVYSHLANFIEHHTESSGGNTPAYTLEDIGHPLFTDLCE